jgi:hypothetical protein
MCFKSASDLGAFDVLQSVVFYWLFGLVPSNLVRQISIGVFQKKTVVSSSLQLKSMPNSVLNFTPHFQGGQLKHLPKTF